MFPRTFSNKDVVVELTGKVENDLPRGAYSGIIGVLKTSILNLEEKDLCVGFVYNNGGTNQQKLVKLSYGDAVLLGGFKSGLNNDNREC